jgi:hypothetical protein
MRGYPWHMNFAQVSGRKSRGFTSALILAILFSGNSAIAAPTPTPAASSDPAQGASDIPKVAPIFADTKAPLVKSITTSTGKVDGQFNFGLQMIVRIHRNTLISASVVLSPKTLNAVEVDPIFQAPCAKFNNISLATLSPSGDLSSLQSRVIDGDWYVETHVFTSVTRLPADQDICPGQYVVTSINLIDAAKHTLSISANLASTAITAPAAKTGTTASKTTYNDIPAQISNIWSTHLQLAPCTQAINVNPITTIVPGKTTIVNGRSQTSQPTTKTEIPSTPAALRTTCDHTADFAKVYLSAVASTAMGGTGETKSSGSTLVPVIDYASVTKIALEENKTMKSQLEVLTKKVDGLMRTIEIYKSGGEPPAATKSEDGLAVVDYQAKAKALEAKVTSLSKQLKALKASKAKSATPVKKAAAPKITNSNTQRPSAGNPTPRSTRTRSGNGNWRNSNNRTPTPKPSVR